LKNTVNYKKNLSSDEFDTAVNRPETDSSRHSKTEKFVLAVLLALAVLIWLPRLQGPIDMRWDGGVYYILGTSIAEGKGYKLLNEPGEIDAVQYPPLLPLIIAGYQTALGTSDPTVVGWWLRISAFLLFLVYIYLVFVFLRKYLSVLPAFCAAVVCLFSMQVYFLSDLCFPELPFSLTTLLFLMTLGRDDGIKNTALAYTLAVVSYGLRTVGIVVFAVWVLESLGRKNFKQAAVRLLLVAIPIFCWQFYTASVEAGDEYNNPAYAYQRAPYMFYNVTYTRNIALHDPFSPEKGERRSAGVVLHNAVRLPVSIGETVSAMHWYWNKVQRYPMKTLGVDSSVTKKISLGLLYLLGFFVLGGILLLWKRDRLSAVPYYLVLYLAALCLVPFAKQYGRYLMPVTPLLVLALFVFLLAVRDFTAKRFSTGWSEAGKYFGFITLSTVLLVQLYCLFYVFLREHRPVNYLDRSSRPVSHRLFFDIDKQREFDLCVTYVRKNAAPDEVVAAGTPHWIYLQTGLKAVMIPFEKDPETARRMLDSVPVKYLIVGDDVVRSERYMLPVVERFPAEWKKVYSAAENGFAVYRHIDHPNEAVSSER
jgi:hypothetical protein